jgi:hypothetical protein
MRLEDFRHRSVLGRDKKRAMRSHQENRGQNQPRPQGMMGHAPQPKTGQCRKSDANLRDLPNNQGISFAVLICQVAGNRAKNRPGRVEKNRHQRNGVGLRHRFRIDREEHRRGMNGLIVEGGQELGDEQTDERP